MPKVNSTHIELSRAMKERKLSRRQTAKILGVSYQYFTRILGLKYTPNPTRIHKEFAQKLFELTGRLPEQLFPEGFCSKDYLDQPSDVQDKVAQKINLYGGVSNSLHTILELRELLQQIFCKLRPKDREIITARFIEGKTLRELGKEKGVTFEAIRLREARALRKFRHQALINGLTVYIH